MTFISDLRDHFKGASTPMEKRLLFKLDFFILTFCCMALFMSVNAAQCMARNILC